MKITYFTRALPDELYEHLLNEGYPLNNPSNQNYHSRLIAALKKFSEVECIGILPANVAPEDIKPYEGWHYLLPRGILIPFGNQLANFNLRKPDFVFFDTLAVKLGKAALSFAREKGAKSVGIITDNPKNIAKASFLYRNGVEELWKDTSISLAVCSSLALPDKPSFLLPGLVREEEVAPHEEKGPYLYFAGALTERFGVPSLLEAYKEADLSWPLLVAGHAASLEFSPKGVKYLGQLTERENAAYESGAALLLNPRPLDAKLDVESVPSKMFEYLASGQPIVSTAHPYFAKRFKDDIEFVNPNGFAAYFKAHRAKDGTLFNLKPNRARKKVVNEYGLSAWADRLSHFLAETMASSK